MVLFPRCHMYVIALLILWPSVAIADTPQNPAANPLPACPDRPNCVRSDSLTGRHHIAAIRYIGSRATAMARVRTMAAKDEHMTIQSQNSTTIHITVASTLFGFVDDVHLYFPLQVPIIHLRSASRTGYYDFGVNRRRMEDLRRALTQAKSTQENHE